MNSSINAIKKIGAVFTGVMCVFVMVLAFVGAHYVSKNDETVVPVAEASYKEEITESVKEEEHEWEEPSFTAPDENYEIVNITTETSQERQKMEK